MEEQVTAPRVFAGVAELAGSVGEHLGRSGPHRVGHADIVAFAEATGDRQWIHVDQERAAAGPYRTTVAHGYYLLSIMPTMLAEIFRVDGVGAVINTGVDRLRFHHPVPAGSQLTVAARLAAVRTRRRGVAELSVDVEVFVDGQPEPACTAVVHSMVRPPSAAESGQYVPERAGSR
jgi:acyl dehydratase